MVILRPHSSYRRSENDLLGLFPTHWVESRLRFAVRLNPSKAEVSGRDPDEEVSFVPMDAVGEDGSLRLDQTRSIAAVESGYTYFRDGDVVVAKITPCFENGKGAIMRNLIGGVGFGTTELIVARPLGGTSAGFIYWLFSSSAFRSLGEGAMYGAGGQKRVADDFVRDFAVALPPPSEQSAIAAFLDRETGKIDALVGEQRRLIELLKEKRQAVISHAVTKGLDPSAPMKDSGVEWLGEVPAHWEVMRLKFLARIQTGVAKGKDVAARTVITLPYLRVANVQDGHIVLSDVATMDLPPEDAERYLLRPGDVLMNEGGDFDKLGRGALWDGEIDPCIHQNHVFAVRPFGVAPTWLNAITGSDYARFFFMGRSKQSTNLASISSTNIMELPVVVPPGSEQEELLTWLGHQTATVDALASEAQAAINLLQERRSALISAAVTGKIDVRGWSADDVRKAVAAEIIYLNAGDRTFGRVKNQKLLYLAQAYAGVDEIDGRYERKAAGPHDGGLMTSIEAALTRDGLVTVNQAGGPGAPVAYSATRGARPDRARLKSMLGERLARLDRLLTKLEGLSTHAVEGVATLYAVWNDALLDGETPTDARLVRGFLDEWHPEKRQKFNESEVRSWLEFLRRNDLAPQGRGPRTQAGALL